MWSPRRYFVRPTLLHGPRRTGPALHFVLAILSTPSWRPIRTRAVEASSSSYLAVHLFSDGNPLDCLRLLRIGDWPPRGRAQRGATTRDAAACTVGEVLASTMSRAISLSRAVACRRGTSRSRPMKAHHRHGAIRLDRKATWSGRKPIRHTGVQEGGLCSGSPHGPLRVDLAWPHGTDPLIASALRACSRMLPRFEREVGRQRVLRLPSWCSSYSCLRPKASLAGEGGLLEPRPDSALWHASIHDLAVEGPLRRHGHALYILWLRLLADRLKSGSY